MIAGISIPKGALLDAKGECMETLRFVVSTFLIDFQFLVQTGIDDPKQSEWEFVPVRLEVGRGDAETKFFKVIDVVVKLMS